MKFDDLDAQMRVFETSHDHCVLPGMHIVARLDGRNFTRLTKEAHQFEAPFDIRFRDMMVHTVEHLMNSGFNILYGYSQSDEISLLFHPKEDTFGCKLRKINSVLAGEASAAFSHRLNDIGVFDCRVSQLPRVTDVVAYFRWRNEDAHRNALNAHCYWNLRGEGLSVQEATLALDRLSVSAKNELLFERGINFNDLPAWQKRGFGAYWEEYQKPSWNPVKKKEVMALRQRLRVDFELPLRDEYAVFVAEFLNQ